MRAVRKVLAWVLVYGLALYLAAVGLLLLAGLRDDVARSDVGLVLGNQVYADGSLSPRLRARLDEALRLYRGGWFPLIVVSGGVGQEGQDEAVAMRRYLVSHAVPAESIVVDGAGINTFESARNLRSILAARRLRSVLVVTQYFHVPRAKLALRRFGIGPVHGSHARYFEWRDVYSVQRELVGYVRYATRDYPAE